MLKTDLSNLARLWVSSFPKHWADESEVVAVPETILNRLTSQEPYRSRAIKDIQLLMRLPLLHGIGLEVRLIEPFEVAPFGGWAQSIGGLGIDVNWARDMSGRETEGLQLRLERVAIEADVWHIIEVMNDE